MLHPNQSFPRKRSVTFLVSTRMRQSYTRKLRFVEVILLPLLQQLTSYNRIYYENSSSIHHILKRLNHITPLPDLVQVPQPHSLGKHHLQKLHLIQKCSQSPRLTLHVKNLLDVGLSSEMRVGQFHDKIVQSLLHLPRIVILKRKTWLVQPLM